MCLQVTLLLVNFCIASTVAATTMRKLNNRNFEHLTQASTGSTTGDWLIYFDLFERTEVTNLLEGLAHELLNIGVVTASIDCGDPEQIDVCKYRFGIDSEKANDKIMFMHQGKTYSYTSEMHNL